MVEERETPRRRLPTPGWCSSRSLTSTPPSKGKKRKRKADRPVDGKRKRRNIFTPRHPLTGSSIVSRLRPCLASRSPPSHVAQGRRTSSAACQRQVAFSRRAPVERVAPSSGGVHVRSVTAIAEERPEPRLPRFLAAAMGAEHCLLGFAERARFALVALHESDGSEPSSVSEERKSRKLAAR